MAPQLDPIQFWNARLADDPSLRGTGHRAFSLAYNNLLYAAQAEALADVLKKWQVDVRGKAVLDVGSGVGFYISLFESYGAREIVGLDAAQSSISYLRNKFGQHQFYLADIGSPDFALDCQFDFVSIISVLYHLVDERRFECAVHNLARLMKPGGYLILSDQMSVHWLAPRHVRFRSLETYTQLLNGLGCEVLDVTPVYYLMNRTIIPKFGPWLLSQPPVTRALFRIDQRWRRSGRRGGSSMNFLLAKRLGSAE